MVLLIFSGSKISDINRIVESAFVVINVATCYRICYGAQRSIHQVMIHPLVRDLYKRVVTVSKDYPTTTSTHDHQYIKQLWKTAIRNPDNCPSWYTNTNTTPTTTTTTTNDTDGSIDRNTSYVTNASKTTNDISELYHAVHRGRQMVKEMIGIVQLHKYRAMKQRYNDPISSSSSSSDGDTTTKELYAMHNHTIHKTTTTTTKSSSSSSATTTTATTTPIEK